MGWGKLFELGFLGLKEFILTNSEHPIEIKTIFSSLLSINQAIEKTNFHGKTNDDYLINDTIYTVFIINTVVTAGLYLNSYYKTKFPKQHRIIEPDSLPF